MTTQALLQQSDVPAGVRADIIDTLYRFAAGQDVDDQALFESAFARDAILDFVQPASRLGVRLQPFEGREAIVQAVLGATADLDTTHTVTNPRVIEYAHDRARITALIEAQHLPRSDHSRNLLLKNLLSVEVVREEGRWAILHIRFENVWASGDPAVLFPPHESR